jgi:FMN phosphatase YigB (HAD superfamily)
MTTGAAPAIVAVTLDFGNTLVPVSAAGLRGVVETTARAMAERLGPFAPDEVLRTWAEERERQFREEVPQFREVDLSQRLTRILARLRGMVPPPPDARWDDVLASARSRPDEIAWAVDVYSRAFVEALPASPAAGALLERLARRYRVAIVSNWPLAATIDRYVEAAGWSPHLAAVVVSQRVGAIKPHPAIFAAARAALGDPMPASIIHVGDDWQADVVGAQRAGWRTAFLHDRPHDSPLPGSTRDASVVPDLELTTLADLEPGLVRLEAARAGAPGRSGSPGGAPARTAPARHEPTQHEPTRTSPTRVGPGQPRGAASVSRTATEPDRAG